MDWYYALNGTKTGPISRTQLDELGRSGALEPDTLVWGTGMADWAAWSAIPKTESTASGSLADIDSAPCVECQGVFAQNEMIPYEGAWICANCKPLVVQRIREGVIPITGGIWRSKKQLVVSLDAKFPERCIKCNQPTSNGQLQRKLTWHNPAVYIALVLNVLIYIIIAMCVRKKATALISVCPAHRSQRRTALLVGWLGSAGAIALGIVGAIYEVAGLAILAVLIFLGSILFAAFRGRLISATKIDKKNAWVQGCCPEFLAAFPEWTNAK